MSSTGMTNEQPMRRAVVKGGLNVTLAEVQDYLPSNYGAVEGPEGIVIEGADNAGWTLDGYVIPRLASGLIFAEEVPIPENDNQLTEDDLVRIDAVLTEAQQSVNFRRIVPPHYRDEALRKIRKKVLGQLDALNRKAGESP